MEAIHWPKEFTPGFTDNFVSAETYVAGLTAEEVFPYLTHAYIWHEFSPISLMPISGMNIMMGQVMSNLAEVMKNRNSRRVRSFHSILLAGT